MNAPASTPVRSSIRKIVVAIIAVLLIWFVGAQGIAALATRSTDTALLSRFDPGAYPAVGIRLAQILLDQGRAAQAVAQARPAALANPMSVRAVRVLGLALEADGKPTGHHVMRVAERLSWRDTTTSLWVLRDAALNQDVPRVLRQVDALARRQVQSDLVSKVYYGGFADAPSRKAFAGLLATNPPWRSSFFANIRVNLRPGSFQQMEALLDQLDRTKAPSTADERLTFIDRMVDSGDGTHARAYWLRSFGIPSTAQAQTPYDPQFRVIAARQQSAPVSPFEWVINQDANQFIELRQTDTGPGLDITPGSADGTSLIAQALTLAPGSHRIDTVVEGPVDRAPAGWQLTCQPAGTPLVRTFAHSSNELSGINVEIPTSGCTMQRLILTANGRIGARPVSLRQVTIH